MLGALDTFFPLEEGSLPEQHPGSTPLAPFARVEDLARLLSTSSSSNFFLLMNLEELLRLGMVPKACEEARFCPASDSSSSERLAGLMPSGVTLAAPENLPCWAVLPVPCVLSCSTWCSGQTGDADTPGSGHNCSLCHQNAAMPKSGSSTASQSIVASAKRNVGGAGPGGGGNAQPGPKDTRARHRVESANAWHLSIWGARQPHTTFVHLLTVYPI